MLTTITLDRDVMSNTTVYVTPPVTQGEAMLRAVPASIARIARELAVRSRQSVHLWRHGLKLPSQAARARMRDVYSIPVETWDRPPDPPGERVPATTASSSTPTPVRAISEIQASAAAVNGASATLADTQALIDEVRRKRAAPGLSALDYLRVVRMEAQLLRQKAGLELAAEQVDDRIVRNNPRWRQLREALADILSHYPEAAERVAVMLDRLDL
jgi:hypothetical protein